MKKQSFSITINNQNIVAEFSDLTHQTNGSVLIKSQNTTVLVTAVMSKKENSDLDYFPLSVEFEEKFYAVGQIMGSRFQRREGRPSDEAILSARIIDRTIRPLFNQKIRHEVQVVVTVLAVGEADPDVLGVIGASLALGVSDIPWGGPVGAVRLAQKNKDSEIVVNPTYQDREEIGDGFEILSCGFDNMINMIETFAYEITEDKIISALEKSVLIHNQLTTWQNEIISTIGKEKQKITIPEVTDDLKKIFTEQFSQRLSETIFSGIPGKKHIQDLKKEFIKTCTSLKEDEKLAADFFEEKIDEELHRGAVIDNQRADGRNMDEIRNLYAQAGGVSDILHGSGIFYRGDTHIFSALTLGGPQAAQMIDTIEAQDFKKRFLHHYNFPPFSVGETGRVGGFNRRMIGHGALAEKALLPVIPTQEEFPYTIRLVSETFSSNGSSSMGSVCASTLALMDGGVPIIRPVAGIASGLMMLGDKYKLLTDIQGPEDEFGDMDFKVAGTTKGVTAIQMDVKVKGIPVPVLEEALQKAKAARLQILGVINSEIPATRAQLSSNAPHIISLKINPNQIGLVIGSGGKTITKIKEESEVEEIDIEDDGKILITGKINSAQIAADKIKSLTKIYEVGENITATITKIVDFGAFARLDDYNEGLIHISEIANFRVEDVSDYLTVGDEVPVTVTKINEGKIGLSIKQAVSDFIKQK